MQYSKEEKAMWLEDWKQSGKKAWTYAKENGIAPQTFVNWTKPKSKSNQPIIEIPAKILQTTRRIEEIQIEKEGVKINIPITACEEELKTIFKLLGVIQ